jgi:hypothetical protein
VVLKKNREELLIFCNTIKEIKNSADNLKVNNVTNKKLLESRTKTCWKIVNKSETQFRSAMSCQHEFQERRDKSRGKKFSQTHT